MKTTLRIALAAALSLLFVSPVMAQEGDVKTKEITFEDDTVLGDLHDANFLDTRVRERGELMSLVRSRADFVDQLLAEVEDLGE